MASGIFISYSSKDAAAAEEILAALERADLHCWIAPRDIPADTEWAVSIIDAIRNAPLFLQLISENANASAQMKREIEHATNRRVPVFAVRIADVAPSDKLQFFLRNVRLFDAYTPPLKDHLPRLVAEITGRIDGRLAAPPR